MSDTTTPPPRAPDWNVLCSPWLEVMSLEAKERTTSPLLSLQQASTIRCIAAASSLDLFAAHRFLLTLLYWKANVAGGVQELRRTLLDGRVPEPVLDAIGAEAHRFRLIDPEAPFLQDPSVAKHKKAKSVGSLFADFASGTNIAHFHHGHDKEMRVCVRCATVGMLRVIPWSQAGGQGITPSVHSAPPIMALATGMNLAITLGLNLVPLPVDAGDATWTGHFKPTKRDSPIPHLEAFTWNPRRIHLPPPETADGCWACGQATAQTVGPIVYLKNEATSMRKVGKKTIPFEWRDPSAFYAPDARYRAMRSRSEKHAAIYRDLGCLLNEEDVPKSAVVALNPSHERWHLVIPCTNPANNKTFDHRSLELTGPFSVTVRAERVVDAPDRSRAGFDGWVEPRRPSKLGGASRFVRAAERLLTESDWAALSAAAFKGMHEAPAAFDIFSGLYWGLRDKVKRLPSRNAAWLVLKLMAAVPARARLQNDSAVENLLRHLPRRQLRELRGDRHLNSIYPVSFPRGNRLVADLHREIDKSMRRRKPQPIDWAGICDALDQLLD